MIGCGSGMMLVVGTNMIPGDGRICGRTFIVACWASAGDILDVKLWRARNAESKSWRMFVTVVARKRPVTRIAFAMEERAMRTAMAACSVGGGEEILSWVVGWPCLPHLPHSCW